MELFPVDTREGLTLFSFGGGQDSHAILYKLAERGEWYDKYVPSGRLLIVMSDTGAEHPRTLVQIKKTEQYCKEQGFEFVLVTKEMGFHSESWQTLWHQYQKNTTIGSVAYQQTCTDNLKVKVVDRYLQYWVKDRFDLDKTGHTAVYEFVAKHGQIRLILGFADGENRTAGSKHDAVWKQRCMTRVYPLIEEKVDRPEAQRIIKESGHDLMPPSNCMICFYMSEQELLWLHRFHPEVYAQWVKIEAAKMERFKEHKNNLGVFGRMTIADKLEKAMKAYGDWTDEQLEDYKMSHGHCVKSRY